MLDYPFWIRDGKELYPKDIDDDYLLNIINYMRNNANDYYQAEIVEYRQTVKDSLEKPVGEFFIDDFLDNYDDYARYLNSVSPLEWLTGTVTYITMAEEAEKRGLDIFKKQVKSK